MEDSYLLPADDFDSSAPVTKESIRSAMAAGMNPEPDYYLSFNEWFRSGFIMNESGQLVGWRDPGPRLDDGK